MAQATVSISASDPGATSGITTLPALIVLPGGRLEAQGTAASPVLMSTVMPDRHLPRAGLWGGVTIVGRAPVDSDGQLEFMPSVRYGGDRPDDDSGILTHVAIWFAGHRVAPGVEFNGLTLAGVGNGTRVEDVEVGMSLDDGIEVFGGNLDLLRASVVLPGDDGFDTDAGCVRAALAGCADAT